MDRTLIKDYHSGPKWTWERWQWRGTQHSRKLQHCWKLTIRLFSVISRTLVRVGILPLCRGAVGVFYCPSQLGKHIDGNMLECISKCRIAFQYQSLRTKKCTMTQEDSFKQVLGGKFLFREYIWKQAIIYFWVSLLGSSAYVVTEKLQFVFYVHVNEISWENSIRAAALRNRNICLCLRKFKNWFFKNFGWVPSTLKWQES